MLDNLATHMPDMRAATSGPGTHQKRAKSDPHGPRGAPKMIGTPRVPAYLSNLAPKSEPNGHQKTPKRGHRRPRVTFRSPKKVICGHPRNGLTVHRKAPARPDNLPFGILCFFWPALRHSLFVHRHGKLQQMQQKAFSSWTYMLPSCVLPVTF